MVETTDEDLVTSLGIVETYCTDSDERKNYENMKKKCGAEFADLIQSGGFKKVYMEANMPGNTSNAIVIFGIRDDNRNSLIKFDEFPEILPARSFKIKLDIPSGEGDIKWKATNGIPVAFHAIYDPVFNVLELPDIVHNFEGKASATTITKIKAYLAEVKNNIPKIKEGVSSWAGVEIAEPTNDISVRRVITQATITPAESIEIAKKMAAKEFANIRRDFTEKLAALETKYANAPIIPEDMGAELSKKVSIFRVGNSIFYRFIQPIKTKIKHLTDGNTAWGEDIPPPKELKDLEFVFELLWDCTNHRGRAVWITPGVQHPHIESGREGTICTGNLEVRIRNPADFVTYAENLGRHLERVNLGSMYGVQVPNNRDFNKEALNEYYYHEVDKREKQGRKVAAPASSRTDSDTW